MSVLRKPEKVYSAVGRCIYCGASDSLGILTNEHIVPLSLEGIWVLPKSSCETCAKATSAIEQICSRTLYGSFRIRENLKTRRPKKRPKDVAASFSSTDADAKLLMVPQQAAIGQFPIFHLQPPGALQEPPDPSLTWEGVTLEVKTDGPRDQALWSGLPKGEFSFSQSFDIEAFARLCAKIGHGFAVAEFGLDGFESWLPPYILGDKPHLAYLVGSSDEAIRTDNAANSLSWSLYETSIGTLLAVNIQLFPALCQPPIAAVAGSVSSDQRDRIYQRPDVLK